MACSLMVRRKACMGSRVLGDPAAGRTVSSSNHVGGRVLTPISSGDCINLTFCRRKLWLMGRDHPCWDENIDVV